MFASSIFVPTRPMPGRLQAFVDYQPVSVLVVDERNLVLGKTVGAFRPLRLGHEEWPKLQ